MSSNYKKKKILLMMLFLLFSSYLSTVYAQFNPRNITVGVLAFRGLDAAKKRWEPTIQYLNQQLPEYHFNLIPKNLSTLNDLIKDQDIDFILTNTGHYVLLESLYGVTRIATLRNLRQGKALDNFGSVIFTRAERTDINELGDFVGKSFMGVNKNGFGGFQIAWREFKRAGVDPFSDFSSLSYSGFPQSNIAFAVLEGKVDGGTMRTDSLEKMAKKGKIKLDDFKIINARKVAGFPFLLSSELYPEWPFSRAQHVPLEVAKKVVIALLQIQRNSDVARQGNYAEWTVPSDYQPVHELMKDLKIGSYAEDDKFNLKSLIKTYWLELVTLSIALVVILYLLFIINRRNKALKNSQAVSKSKFNFLANAVRETHSLLTSLITYGKKIDQAEESSNQSTTLHKMLETTDNISNLFHDIQDFSMIEAGNMNLEKTNFNLTEVLDEINKDFSIKLTDHKINLTTAVEGNVPGLLVGDPERLSYIIESILSIAVKFSHDANISLNVKLLKQTADKVDLRFDINDNGMVLNQGQIDMLFNAFVHANILNVKNYGSACLGLYISKKFIELMDGKTWVEKGTGEQRKFGFSCQFQTSK